MDRITTRFSLISFLFFSFFLNPLNSQITVFNTLDNANASYLAYPTSVGNLGVEDYILESSGLPYTDSVELSSLIVVAGIDSTLDGGSAQLDIIFYDSDTLFYDEFTVFLPQEGIFIWTLTPPVGFKIPTEGFVQLFIDDTNAANTGRAPSGRWFLHTASDVINYVGSSPGDFFTGPDLVHTTTFFTPQIPIQNSSLDLCTTSDGPITTTANDFYTAITHGGELIASINDNGGDLGQVDAEFYISTTDRVDAFGAHYLNRTLFIDPATNGPATVRFYIPDSELQALITASAGDANPITSVADLMVTKVDGVTCGATSAGSGGGTSSLVTPSATGAYGTDWYIDFSVTGFSGFSIGGGDAVLPVELSSFEIAEKENGFQLNWTTASELNNQGFEIERSTDGERFENIGFVSGLGTNNDENHYAFEDKSVLKNMDYYYRLKQINYDGRSEYSSILTGIILESKALSMSELMPNPAFEKTSFNISLLRDENLSVEIFDLSGKLYSSVSYQLSSGFQTVDLDLSTLSKGSYLVKIVGQNETQIKKLILQ